MVRFHSTYVCFYLQIRMISCQHPLKRCTKGYQIKRTGTRAKKINCTQHSHVITNTSVPTRELCKGVVSTLRRNLRTVLNEPAQSKDAQN
jgi:hypothetical protein